MLYLLSPSNAMLRDRIRRGQFGAIVTPATRYRVEGLPVWAADNACGPGPHGVAAGYPGDDKFLNWLERLSPHAGRYLFAVAPDVVYDAAATLARFERFAPAIRAMGYPVALAAQNGQELLPVPWPQVDVLFLGGDTSWKMGPATAWLAAAAIARGKQVHMGRVNGGGRYAYARAIGCSTADGLCINRAPNRNLRYHALWERRPVQGVIF